MLDKFGLRAFLGFCFIIPNVFLAPADSSGVFVDVCANVQGKKEPVSEWGTYTRITKDQTNDFFDYIFSKIPPGTTKCKVTTDFRLSRSGLFSFTLTGEIKRSCIIFWATVRVRAVSFFTGASVLVHSRD